ncbi:MAG TPA: succinate dehydrogenase, hydrophobic membrane anchor protein [Caulobacteraceae bacterium]
MDEARYRTPLGRARGLGAAGHGAGHWISERVSSMALVPLVLWIAYAALQIAGAGYEGAIVWVSHPLNAVLLTLLLAIGFQHMHAGMRVVVEDYIHQTSTKALLLILNLFVCVLGGALAVFSVLKVALGGGAF